MGNLKLGLQGAPARREVILMQDCANCVVEAGERAKNSEICCMAGRACCYACMEDCPVKEEYNLE